MSLKRPEDYGRWEGTQFVFDPPITVTDENGEAFPMHAVETSRMVLPADTTADDVITALLNPSDATVYRDEPAP